MVGSAAGAVVGETSEASLFVSEDSTAGVLLVGSRGFIDIAPEGWDGWVVDCGQTREKLALVRTRHDPPHQETETRSGPDEVRDA